MTISDIACGLGVSKTTVSRAISGNGRISAATSERVRNYMKEHNFRPNAIAQNLATLKTRNIAFAVPFGKEFTSIPFFMRCMAGASKTAAENAYDIVIVNDSLEETRRVIENGKVDGVIVSRNLADDSVLKYLVSSEKPFVLVGTTELAGVVQVDNDNRAACREFTAKLTEMYDAPPGLIIGEIDFAVNRMRASGFTDAIFSLKGEFSDDIAWNATDETSVVKAYAAMYARGVRLFFCGDDVICAQLLRNLRELPPDVRVGSFYNSDVMEDFHPETPTIDFDAQRLGECACQLIMRKIDGENVPLSTMLDYEIKIKNPYSQEQYADLRRIFVTGEMNANAAPMRFGGASERS